MSIFSNIQVKRPKMSNFDLSHEKKLTSNMGELIPILLQETIPGDSMRINTEQLIRFHPMIAPIMHRIDSYIHYFWVPNRLIWDNFDKFITGGEDGLDKTLPPTLYINNSNKSILAKGSLADYLGLPVIEPTVNVVNPLSISALPFRAYQLIYNEYYRDQNLIDKVPLTKADGTVSTQEETEITRLRLRAWEKDYFGAALPFAQKGGEVLIPSTTEVNYLERSSVKVAGNGSPSNGPLEALAGELQAPSGSFARIENVEDVELQASINDLRKAARLQEWLEKNARAGSRLFESMLVHFGVVQDDLRIGRPKYLGGGRTPVTISEVLSSFENTDTFLGQMGGHAVSVGNKASCKAFFKEHGFVIGIMSIKPKAAFMQGVPKLFLRKDKFDYAWPEFSQLGEQEIEGREIYQDFTGQEADNTKAFGYIPRYSEYKYGINTVHGDFKDNLSYWHAGRIFNTRPELNKSFIECNTSEIENRIFPVADSQATDKLYIQLYNNVKAKRPLPYFGTPTL